MRRTATHEPVSSKQAMDQTQTHTQTIFQFKKLNKKKKKKKKKSPNFFGCQSVNKKKII
jgi:hypothetical protein